MSLILRPCASMRTSSAYTSLLPYARTRWQSTLTAGQDPKSPPYTMIDQPDPTKQILPEAVANHLARLSTSSLLKNIFLSVFLRTPLLFKPGFAVFEKIANSSWSIANPDKNPVIRALVRPLIYDHFCAGTNVDEIRKTSTDIKGLGFSGIVLCYGKEVQVNAGNTFVGHTSANNAQIGQEVAQWRDGNLETLDMVQEGDWLGMKISGAGAHITHALLNGSEAPYEFTAAMDAICERAMAKGCRIWVDAEQQFLQPTIDEWTFAFMKKFNKGDTTLIYSTVQAYLKESRDKIEKQLRLSKQENWTLGMKLVRGAYINNDKRDKIHDTKADTDASYNGIVRDLLSGSFPSLQADTALNFNLLLAGHNSHTIRTAAQLAVSLAADGKLRVVPEFAQLQGMADDIGCELLQFSENIKNDSQMKVPAEFHLRVYKCLTWGTVQECMQYLLRRLVENQSAAERMAEGMSLYAKELQRRLKVNLWRR